jgi:hypothetical protein
LAATRSIAQGHAVVIPAEFVGCRQQVMRQLLKLVDQGSGWEYRKGRGWLPEVGGDLPGCGERPDASLAVTPGRRQVVGPLAGHDVLNEEPNRPGSRQRAEFDARSDRQG